MSGTPESRARALLRMHGCMVESVSWVRAQHDGEFMCLVEPIQGGWSNSRFVPRDVPNASAEVTIRFLLGMDSERPDVSQTFDITRIHVGTHAVRIYLRWAQ